MNTGTASQLQELAHPQDPAQTHDSVRAPEPAQAHALSSTWTIWAHLPQVNDWTIKGYTRVGAFSTVEDMVGIMELLPEGLIKNCMLFIMKGNVEPMWEAPQNRNGGCFSYKIVNKFVTDAWKDLCYVMAGGTLSQNAKFMQGVTGITISPKKNFCIVKVWTASCEFQNPQIVTTEVRNLSQQGCLFKKHAPEF